MWSGQVPLAGDAGRWAMTDVNPGQPFGALCRDLQKYGVCTVLALYKRLSVAASLSHFRWEERCTLLWWKVLLVALPNL